MKRLAAVAVLVFLLAPLAFAGIVVAPPVTVGYLGRFADASFVITPNHTYVNLHNPATSSGEVTAAVVRWNRAGCSFKVKFFRPVGSTLLYLGERGPFSTAGQITLARFPSPMSLNAGDVIGLTTVSDCGFPLTNPAAIHSSILEYASDVTHDVSVLDAALEKRDAAMHVYATGAPDDPILVGTIPAAAALAGVGGVLFKTEVQLSAPAGAGSGLLVYHPEGTSGSLGDPTLTWTLPTYGTLTYADVVGALHTAGKGSIDVYSNIAYEPPVVTARVYEDDGAAGTKGFTEPEVYPEQVLQRYEYTSFTAPADATNFRMNLGIRTMDQPTTTLGLNLFTSDGILRGSVSKTLPANYYVQTSASEFFGMPIGPGDLVTVWVSYGTAILYQSTIDNRTQDPSMSIGFRHW